MLRMGRFFDVTPLVLLESGLYKTLATPLMEGVARDVSYALFAAALGACKQAHGGLLSRNRTGIHAVRDSDCENNNSYVSRRRISISLVEEGAVEEREMTSLGHASG